MMFVEVASPIFKIVDKFEETERGTKGFGSSGKDQIWERIMDIKLQDSLAESLRWRCKESASETAIKFLDRQQTYAQFDSNANRVAQGLLSFEIKPNCRVAYLAKNTDYFFEIFYGALK